MANLYGPKIVTDGLVLYWDVANKKSYPGDGSLLDLSGNGRDATKQGTVNFVNEFGGVVQFVASTNGRYYETTSFRNVNCTVIGASRYYGSAKQRMITARSSNWLLGHWSGRTTAHYADGWIRLPSATNDTTWRIFASTVDYSADSYGFYVNGAKLAQSSAGANGGPAGISIGGYSVATENSDGQFSFVQIYDRVLSDDEILQNYNALKGRFGL